MRDTVRQLLDSMREVEWSQFEGWAALRCAIGVAVPLLIGLAIDEPLVGVFGAAGAVGVGFGSFQGAYRGRAAVMLVAAFGMAFSVFSGSLAGHSTVATIVVAGGWAFGMGLLVALGQGPRTSDCSRSWRCWSPEVIRPISRGRPVARRS